MRWPRPIGLVCVMDGMVFRGGQGSARVGCRREGGEKVWRVKVIVVDELDFDQSKGLLLKFAS